MTPFPNLHKKTELTNKIFSILNISCDPLYESCLPNQIH